jgi:hypothetical protein
MCMLSRRTIKEVGTMVKYFVGGYKYDEQSPVRMDFPMSVREEFELVLLHSSTVELLDSMSRESGDSYELTISEALKALKEKRRIENKKRNAAMWKEEGEEGVKQEQQKQH